MTTKAKRLRELMFRPEKTVIMEAHNGLSAKIVQETGFEAIWGSGLSVSAALGVRDSNEASWTQVLEVLEFMADSVDIPILLDGDTGYGNFNNMRRLVRKLEQRNVAGVCIEDKLFPKTNSFIDGDKQALADVDEFAGKIRAAKDTQRDDDFMLVARTEAFIAGWGLQEALLRAHAYADAGADVILCHSRRKDSQDVMSFMEHWDTSKAPVVIVPTKYPSEPISEFMKAGVTNFIFANHSLRTVITHLQKNLKTLKDTHDLMSLEDKIVPVSEIFRIQNVAELKESEKRYLPEQGEPPRAIVLAATKGDFGALVDNKPKAMLRIQGKPVLTYHLEAFNKNGIKKVGVVRGYQKDAVDLKGPHYFDNDDFATTGELYSLNQARDFLIGDVVVAYGDVLYDDAILRSTLEHPGEVVVAVDAGFRFRNRDKKQRDLVIAEGVGSPLSGDEGPVLKSIGGDVTEEAASGEWIGLLRTKGKGTYHFTKALDALAKGSPDALKKASLVDILKTLVSEGVKVHVVHTYGNWRDLDDAADLIDSDQAS